MTGHKLAGIYINDGALFATVGSDISEPGLSPNYSKVKLYVNVDDVE